VSVLYFDSRNPSLRNPDFACCHPSPSPPPDAFAPATVLCSVTVPECKPPAVCRVKNRSKPGPQSQHGLTCRFRQHNTRG